MMAYSTVCVVLLLLLCVSVTCRNNARRDVLGNEEIVSSEQLTCNYCYHADLREDCHLNVLQCEAQHVCYVEKSVVALQRRRHNMGAYNEYGYKTSSSSSSSSSSPSSSPWNSLTTMVNMYKMGCEHYSLCRDRIVSGPGPYGYAVTSKVCCCQHLCEEPDGVGEGRLDNCPTLWDNYTKQTNKAMSYYPTTNTLYGIFSIIIIWIIQS